MKIILLGNPVALCRPRFLISGKYPRAYDSQAKIKTFAKNELRKLIANRETDFKTPLSGPISISLSFHMPIPDSLSKTQKNEKLWDSPHAIKPDIDNLCKFVLDVANEVIYSDDSQICELIAKKFYSEIPCTVIEVKCIKKCMNEATEKIQKTFSKEAFDKFFSDFAQLESLFKDYKSAGNDEKFLNLCELFMQFSNNYVDFFKKLSKNK